MIITATEFNNSSVSKLTELQFLLHIYYKIPLSIFRIQAHSWKNFVDQYIPIWIWEQHALTGFDRPQPSAPL